MKKWVTIILAIALCLTPAFALAEPTVESLNGKTFAVLTTPMELTTEMLLPGVSDAKIIQLPTNSECIAALKSGRADFAVATVDSAEYCAQQDETLGYTEVDLTTGFSMLTLSANGELIAMINDAIAQLSKDDIARVLLNEVAGQTIDDGASVEAIGVIDGAETIRVGITGDLPPMDYVDASGNPKGYNVSYMNEIAKIMGVNIEFVQITNDAKFAALLSDKIDLFFWHVMPVTNDLIVASDVYLDAQAALIYVKP